ncbi:MAG: lumazine-binding protein [Mycobacterium sp.]|nr:MAG: lumazine-binding protein [Mycobacterium sp.]
MPLLIALVLVAIVLAVVTGLRSCRGEEISAEAGIGRAVIGQNDALQRGNFADFRRFTCVAEQGTEESVLAAQRNSAQAKGARYVDDVRGFAVNGDRATATVVYHFEKSADDKQTTVMTFAQEGGEWRVCSAGPQ